MVAINKILLPECTGEGRGGGKRNPPRESRLHACSPVHFLLSLFCWRSRPARDPIGYQGGINLYGYVNSSPVGNVDAEGMAAEGVGAYIKGHEGLRLTAYHGPVHGNLPVGHGRNLATPGPCG